MKTLTLSLKRQWFEKIKSGEKKEEYRECSEYWISRFSKLCGKFCFIYSGTKPDCLGVRQCDDKKAYSRERYIAHKEHIRKLQKMYYATHKEHYRMLSQINRLRKNKGAENG